MRSAPDRRRFPRLRGSLSVRIVPASGAPFTARALDISAGGMSISSDRPLRRGASIRVRFRLPGRSGREVGARIVKVDGDVARLEFESVVPFHEGAGVAEHRTSFVGRQAELAALTALLAEHRLVTIAGPPGIGKTRLACQHADLNPDPGLWLADVAHARTADDVCQAIRTAIGVDLPYHRGATPTGQLGSALVARGGGLLVLDNFEHLTPLATDTVCALLALSPELRILITSRELLRVPEEAALVLEPLACADGATTAAEIAACDAGRLFLDRATGGCDPGVHAAAIASILAALDGIPLAIELAASRTNVLSPPELLQRLSHSLDLLSQGGRAGNPRHRTLRGAIDASWELLDPVEQRAFGDCAVFRGGFSLVAAEHVVGRGDADRPVVDTLAALVEKSLVRRIESAAGEHRFVLLDSIRQYAQDRLVAQGGEAEAQERHASYFARLAAEHAGDRDRVADDRENIVAAVGVMLARSPVSADAAGRALRCLFALDPPRSRTDPAGQLARLEPAIAAGLAAAAEPAPVIAAMEQKALLLHMVGRTPEAIAVLERALELARDRDLLAAQASLHAGLAVMNVQVGSAGPYAGHIDASLALVHHVTVPGTRAALHQLLGEAMMRGGASDVAPRQFELALEYATIADDRPMVARILLDLGAMSGHMGQFARSSEYFARALEVAGDSRDIAVAAATGNLAITTHLEGRVDQARALVDRALALCRECGYGALETYYLSAKADILHESGELEQARGLYDRVGQLARTAGRIRLVVITGARSATALAALGQSDLAEQTRGDAEQRATAASDRDRPDLTAILDVSRHAAAAAAAARATRGGKPEATAMWDRVVQFADAAPNHCIGCAPTGTDMDLRMSLRLLRHQIATAALWLSRGQRWFRAPGQARVDLSRRAQLWSMLCALAEHRLARPGEPMAIAAVVEATWPGESMLPEAALNRVKVACTTLRKMGVGELLQREAAGYRIDPLVPILWTRCDCAPAQG